MFRLLVAASFHMICLTPMILYESSAFMFVPYLLGDRFGRNPHLLSLRPFDLALILEKRIKY